MKNQSKFSLSLVAIASLAACGGGGGDSTPAGPASASGPACTIGATAYASGLIEAATCVSVQAMFTSASAAQAAAIKDRDAAVVARNAAIKDRDAALASLTATNAQLATATAAVTQAMADLAAANGNVASLTAQLDAAKAALAAALAAGGDNGAAALAAAQALAAQAAADKASAQVLVAQAAADKAAAQQLSITAAADKATAQTLAEQAAADKAIALAAQATSAANLLAAQAAAAKAAADLAAAQALANTTGLPLCTVPVATGTVLGRDCVLTYAQQLQIYQDAQAAANAFKFTGAYQALNATVVSEAGGKLWVSDETNSEYVSASLSTQTGTAFTGSGLGVGFQHTPTAITGTYALGSNNATLTADYGAAHPKTTFSLSKNLAAVTIGAGVLTGDNGFSNDGGTVSMTVAADGTFTGIEGTTCTFTGKFEAGSDAAYKKVTMTFKSNILDPVSGAVLTQFCTQNKAGQTATGVLALRDTSYLIMAEVAGKFANEGFGGYYGGTAKIASAGMAKAQAAKASSGQSAGLAFLNGTSSGSK